MKHSTLIAIAAAVPLLGLGSSRTHASGFAFIAAPLSAWLAEGASSMSATRLSSGQPLIRVLTATWSSSLLALTSWTRRSD
ncbi:MAG TPA: hypothetical protein VFB61_04265 [Gemmatimonadales bacterium]|nr:hypothetical protein [Gemmatimonadales bacterium]